MGDRESGNQRQVRAAENKTMPGETGRESGKSQGAVLVQPRTSFLPNSVPPVPHERDLNEKYRRDQELDRTRGGLPAA